MFVTQRAHLLCSLEEYKWLVEYCETHEEAVEKFQQELPYCKDLVQLLPLRIAKLKQ